MRRFLYALFLVLWPSWTFAQTPDGMQALRLIPGTYALDARATGLRLFATGLAAQPDSLRDLFRNVRLCSDSARVASLLGEAGLRSVASGYAASLRQMRAGRCEVYFTRSFDFKSLGVSPSREDDVGQGNTGTTGTTPEVFVPVPRTDETPPRIRVLTQPLQTTSRRGTVRVQVVDPESAIASVQMRLWDGRTARMQPAGDNIYAAEIVLPEDYKTETVVVAAQSGAKDPALARVSVARVTHCGPARAVDPGIVRSVQSNLSCLGHDAGPVDGQQGRSTCRGINGYLGQEIDQFNTGKISWEALSRRLGPECELARPVRLSFDSPLVRDADQVTAVINLAQVGAAARIELWRQGRLVKGRDWTGSAQRYPLTMPAPGTETQYDVQVLDKAGKVRDRQTLVLRRPAAVLRLNPAGPIEVDRNSVLVSAQMEVGASAVRKIEALSPLDGTQVQDHQPTGVGFSLKMPKPGETAQVRVHALDRAGQVIARQILVLARPEPDLPLPNAGTRTPTQPQPGGVTERDVASPSEDDAIAQPGAPGLEASEAEGLPSVDGPAAPLDPVILTVEAIGGAVSSEDEVVLRISVENPGPTRRVVLVDQRTGLVLLDRPYSGSVLEERVQMPEPGQSVVIGVAAQSETGDALAGSQIALARSVAPAVQVPIWVWAAGLGVFLAGGALGLRVRKAPAEAGAGAAGMIKPVMTVKSDDAPEVRIPAAGLPAVIFWVEQGDPEVSIDLPSETEDGR